MRNLILSGATGGIGTAICRRFYDLGYFIIALHNHKSERFLENWRLDNNFLSSRIVFFDCDLSDQISTLKVISEICKFYKIDVLINNAGITRDASLMKMDLKDWSNVIDVNLKSIFSITKPVIQQMVTNKSGNIINVSSINALKGQFGQSNYAASKAGIIGFTKSLALEVASKGVRVNAICPGYASTSMLDRVPLEILESIKNSIPTKKLVSTDEIAKLCSFIVEDMPSLVGETISINGGHYLS